jgi:hypothetical protein
MAEIDDNSVILNPLLSIDNLFGPHTDQDVFILSTYLDTTYRTHVLNLLKKIINKQELSDSMTFENAPYAVDSKDLP